MLFIMLKCLFFVLCQKGGKLKLHALGKSIRTESQYVIFDLYVFECNFRLGILYLYHFQYTNNNLCDINFEIINIGV